MSSETRLSLNALAKFLGQSSRTLAAWLRKNSVLPLADENGKPFYIEDHIEFCRRHGMDLSGTMIRCFRTEVDLNASQWTIFRKNLGILRFVYNLFIATNISNHELGLKYQNAYEFSKWLNNVWIQENPDKAWVKEASSKAVKEIICHADKAYRKYLENIGDFKKRLSLGLPVKRKPDGTPKYPQPPRFKKKFVDEPSLYFIKNGVKIERHRIKIPVFGWISLKEKGYLPGRAEVVSGTLKMEAGRVFISVKARISENQSGLSGTSSSGIGVDLGIKNLGVCSDGRIFTNVNKTRRVRNLERRLNRLNRSIQRKKDAQEKSGNGERSRNLIRAYAERQRIYARLANIRTDWIRKMVADLARTKPEYITIENLNVAGMMKNRHLAKAISAQKLSELKELIIQMGHECGIEIRQVSQWYPSSKTCHACGFVKKALKLSERVYKCPVCGCAIDRDMNAALNLRDAREYLVA